ncbi:MAG: DUF2203 domain-containing protein [Pirellulaceae bacterium]|nr:DUF2203 domain-containing protein [Pirellulaceae bacterium]
MNLTEEPFSNLFTLKQANAMLPLVRAITTDMVTLSRQIYSRKEHLSELCNKYDTQEVDSPYHEELLQAKRDLRKESEQLQVYLRELLELGVEPKDLQEGLIDFPSLLDGRVVYLCWKYGEEKIDHWHELNEGFSDRKSLCWHEVSPETDKDLEKLASHKIS